MMMKFLIVLLCLVMIGCGEEMSNEDIEEGFVACLRWASTCIPTGDDGSATFELRYLTCEGVERTFLWNGCFVGCADIRREFIDTALNSICENTLLEDCPPMKENYGQ